MRRFREAVWKHYRKEGRHDLPWRNFKRPLPTGRQAYRILVSEIMLQQTQVERVIPFYKKFLKQFPTARSLARAPLSEVLKMWQGLGYNRRAKMLHQAVREIIARHRGAMPREVHALEELPGVGPYTARAVAAFAFNQDVVFVETNIRTAVIQHFFPHKKSVSDAEIIKVLKRAAPDVALAKSGQWYSALMDYGAHLKASGVRLNTKSKHYTKQSRFAGSSREARGAILRALAEGPCSASRLLSLLGPSRRAQMHAALSALAREGLIQKRGEVFTLPR